jgi:hypothetical protein
MEKSTIHLFSIVLLANYFNFTIIINYKFYTFIIPILKRKIGYSQCLLKDLTIYESEQAIHFKKCDFKKSTAKQFKKIYLNNQQQKIIIIILAVFNLINCSK